MKRFSVRQLLVFVLIIIIGISVCNAQTAGNKGNKHSGKGLFGIFSGKKNDSKIKKPKTANQVIKEQARKDAKVKEDYAKSVKESQKRTIKIQTPEVQDRMKQNKKDITAREKGRNKKTSAATRKAGRKYKK